MTHAKQVVRLRGLVRDFGNVRALDHASLTLREGAVHGVLGENGAGKSTLLRVIGGMVEPDAGTVEINGVTGAPRDPVEARRRGVGFVHQHFRLVARMTVLENLALASPLLTQGRLPLAAIQQSAERLLKEIGWRLPLSARIRDLSVGGRQRTEIVKALLSDPKVLVLDEPTATLAPSEVEALFGLLRKLAEKGMAIALVAHKLDEIMSVADHCTVLRRGRTVLAARRDRVDAAELAQAMVAAGSELGSDHEREAADVVGRQHAGADPNPRGRLEVARYSGGDGKGVRPRTQTSPRSAMIVARCINASVLDPAGSLTVKGVSLDICRGEIVGVVGVEGNGQRELARLMSGRISPRDGNVELPAEIGYIPQDCNGEGVASALNLTENLALAHHGNSGALMDWKALTTLTRDTLARYRVRAESERSLARSLSGGNQQRLVVARELSGARDLVVAANPTRGLDLRATRYVHSVLRRAAAGARAAGVLLVTNDLDEAVELSHRAYAMRRGRLIPASSRYPSRSELGSLMVSGTSSAETAAHASWPDATDEGCSAPSSALNT